MAPEQEPVVPVVSAEATEIVRLTTLLIEVQQRNACLESVIQHLRAAVKELSILL